MKKPKTKVTKAKPVKLANTLFPGRPNYTGPDRGWFAFVHHGKLFEHTSVDGDSIAARVAYVQVHKPKDERAIRLRHIMYLGERLGRNLSAMLRSRHRTQGHTSSGTFAHDFAAKKRVMAYVNTHLPNHKWNGDIGSLVKADGTAMSG